jgi:nicotinate-nucleotide adenylyltransferase
MAKKIAIFGGTFNPIHFGHLRAAVEIREGFGLDAVYLIPSASPPHKSHANLAPAADRMAMVKQAIERHRGLRASDLELKRKGPSFTIDTVCAFRKHLPEDAWLYLIMGIDAFLEIETWKSYQDLLHIIPLIVINRPDHQGRLRPSVNHVVKDLLAQGELQGYECSLETPCFTHCEKQPIFTFNVTGMNISSTHIRDQIRRQKAIDFLVPESVRQYIDAKGLYR